jgi:hypothetical protein
MVRYMIWTRRAQPLGGLFGYLRVNLLGLRVVGYQRRKAGYESQEGGSGVGKRVTGRVIEPRGLLGNPSL